MWVQPPPPRQRSRIATLIVGKVAEPMIEAVSLPPKEATNEYPSYLWRGWSWITNEEVKPIVLRGDELLLTTEVTFGKMEREVIPSVLKSKPIVFISGLKFSINAHYPQR